MIKILALALFFFSSCMKVDSSKNNSGDNRDNETTTNNFVEPNESNDNRGSSAPIGGTNPICFDVIELDGPGDLLSKPVSDSDGNLVVLLPDEFQEELDSFTIFFGERTQQSPLGVNQEQGEYGRFGNAFGDGLPRQHYRFSEPGSFYVTNDNPEVFFVAKSSNGECIFRVPNIALRQD